jgi:hypothetical protein
MEFIVFSLVLSYCLWQIIFYYFDWISLETWEIIAIQSEISELNMLRFQEELNRQLLESLNRQLLEAHRLYGVKEPLD